MRIRKQLGKIKRLLILLLKVNWYKTLFLNFKYFKPIIAIKVPIICYGKIKIYSLNGKINISCKIKPGVIQIGRDTDNMSTSALPVRLRIDGALIFFGHCIISGGTNITVGKDAIIEIGQYTRICSGVFLKAVDNIKIGSFTWITAECIVMDSDIHYIKHTESGIVYKNSSPIVIGNYCWIVMRSIVSKGAVIPDYSIVARNSFVNKDYSISQNKGLLLAGSPAVELKAGLQYIPYFNKEKELHNYFKNHPGENSTKTEAGFEDYSQLYHPDFNIL